MSTDNNPRPWKKDVTKGEWEWVYTRWSWELRSTSGETILDDGSSGGEYERVIEPDSADAQLILEAGNVLHQTGMTPGELAERVKELERENARLIEDRARFPDRPDDVGIMIGSHFKNLKAQVDAAEDAFRRNQRTLEIVSDELKTVKEKSNAFRNRLVSALTDAGSGVYELRRSAAEAAVYEFEDAFDAARAARE